MCGFLLFGFFICVGVFCVCYNMWVCVCVNFVMCVCSGNTCTCIYSVLCSLYSVFVLFLLCTFIPICFVCSSVRITATE